MKRKNKLAAFLQRSGSAITNSLKDEGILSRLSKYNYDISRIEEGKSLYDEAFELFNSQSNVYGAQKGAHQAFTKKKVEADKVIHECISIARIAFENDKDALTALNLKGMMRLPLNSRFNNYKSFYKSILENSSRLARMAEYGFDSAFFENGLSLAEETELLYNEYMSKKGDAQTSTILRNNKLEELHNWMRHFYIVATVALRDRPQYLEKLGIVVH